MKLISIMYHDVVEGDHRNESGFFGGGADLYKIEKSMFREQISLIQEVKKQEKPVLVGSDLIFNRESCPWALTFDDGGISAHAVIARELEKFGYLSHFFITTEKIGNPRFVDAEQIRDLRKMGHIIGSHSHTHPDRMSHCTWDEILEEWEKSIHILSGILNEPVSTASVPGGYFSKKVAQAASKAGIRKLFTSEPVQKGYMVDDCMVLGRYSINRNVSVQVCAEIAMGKVGPCFRQWLLWNSKKIAKSLVGNIYLKLRSKLLK